MGWLVVFSLASCSFLLAAAGRFFSVDRLVLFMNPDRFDWPTVHFIARVVVFDWPAGRFLLHGWSFFPKLCLLGSQQYRACTSCAGRL